MRRLLFSLIPWILIFGIGFLAGDRYGAPGWMRSVAGTGFSAVETAAGGALGGLLDRGRDSESDDAGAQSEDDGSNASDADSAAAEQAAASTSDVLRANRDLKINAAGLKIIKDSEGLALEPYSAGGSTYIGYGHQLREGESFQSISEAKAEALLKKDIAEYEQGVRESLTRKANVNQFSAMVSLAYNKGVYGFRDTNVLKRFNQGDIQGAADDFRSHTGRNGPVPHLVERRERERMLFLKPV